MYIKDTWRSALFIARTNYSTISDNILDNAGIKGIGTGSMGGVFVLNAQGTESGTEVYVLRNIIRNSTGATEGMAAFNQIQGITYMYNVIHNNTGRMNVNVYLNMAKNCIFAYNLVYNNKANGVSINNEEEVGVNYTGGHLIYGNLIANNSSTGLIIGNDHNHINDPDATQPDNKIYNNTFVDNDLYNIRVTEYVEGTGNEFKNNISWILDGGGVHISDVAHDAPTYDYNLWSSIPIARARGVNDPAYASPLLTKSSGWQDLIGGAVTGAEFALLAGSPAIDAGVDLTSYDDMINPNTVNFTLLPPTIDLIDGTAYGAAHDIGAMVYALFVSSISPEDDAVAVINSAGISWVNPTGYTSVDVYLEEKSGSCDLQAGDMIKDGLDISSVSNADMLTHLSLTGQLTNDTTYCWKVDVNHAGGTEAGVVYEFTTTVGPPATPTQLTGIEINTNGIPIVVGN